MPFAPPIHLRTHARTHERVWTFPWVNSITQALSWAVAMDDGKRSGPRYETKLAIQNALKARPEQREPEFVTYGGW